MKRKQPKFKVGQVVALRKEQPDAAILFGKIRVRSLPEGGQLYNVDGYAFRESDLRPLTKREKGQQPKGRRDE